MKPFGLQRMIPAGKLHLPFSLCEISDQTLTIASGVRADEGQEVFHEMRDYQPNARVEVCMDDVTQVHARGVEGLSVTPPDVLH